MQETGNPPMPGGAGGAHAVPAPYMDDEIDLFELILPILENWKQIAAAAALAGLLAGAVSLLMPPRYEAEARLRILPLTAWADVGWSSPPPSFYHDLARDPGVAAAVAQAVGVPAGEGNEEKWFQDHVSIQADEKSAVVTLRASAPTAREAAALADAAAEVLRARAAEAHRASLRAAVTRELAQVEAKVRATQDQLAATPQRLWMQEALAEDPLHLAAVLERVAGDEAVAAALREAGAVMMARQVVNPVWEELALRLADLQARRAQLESHLAQLEAGEDPETFSSLVLLHKASIPQQPVSPRKALNVAVGVILGGMLGVFWVFVRRMWDRGTSLRVSGAGSGRP